LMKRRRDAQFLLQLGFRHTEPLGLLRSLARLQDRSFSAAAVLNGALRGAEPACLPNQPMPTFKSNRIHLGQ
jgi:hypothetical protein